MKEWDHTVNTDMLTVVHCLITRTETTQIPLHRKNGENGKRGSRSGPSAGPDLTAKGEGEGTERGVGREHRN